MRKLLPFLLLIFVLACSAASNPVTSSGSLFQGGTGTTTQGNPSVKVWVNTPSSVYHCPGTRWYGNTIHGEYMTQKQAQEKGNRPAHGKPCQ